MSKIDVIKIDIKPSKRQMKTVGKTWSTASLRCLRAVNVEKTFHFATHSRLPIVSSYQRKVNFRKNRSRISYFVETHKSQLALSCRCYEDIVEGSMNSLKVDLTRQSRTIAGKLSSSRYAFHNYSLLSAISQRHFECHWTFAFCIFFFRGVCRFYLTIRRLRDGEEARARANVFLFDCMLPFISDSLRIESWHVCCYHRS